MKTRVITILLCVTACIAAAHAEEPVLTVALSIGPSDGGVQYLGRMSDFHVVLTNISDKTQRVWQDWNSWGYNQLSFIFTDAEGKQWVIRKGMHIWTKNSPEWWVVEPHQCVVFDVNFSDKYTHWEGLPEVKTDFVVGKLEAVFESKEGLGARNENVWKGKVVSKTKAVKYYPEDAPRR